MTDQRRGSATTVASWILVATFVVIALAAPLISPYRPTAPAGAPLEPPSAGHVLGTNAIGQDVASQMVSGTRVSLVIAALAGFGTLAIGAVIGLAAALGGPVVDRVLMRIVDLMLTIPRLPLLIVVSLYVGPTLLTMALVISLTGWPSTARVVRSQTLSLRSRAHLAAVRGFGGSMLYATRRHVVPELGLILIAGFIGAAGRSVVLEAGLAFLGLGDPTRMSWGRILRDAVDFGGLFFTDAWAWWLLPPVLAISLLLLSLSFLGVAAERRLAPRLRRHEDLRA